jgi:hypothetical protein
MSPPSGTGNAIHRRYLGYLLVRDLQPFPEALHHQFLTGAAPVDVLDVVCRRLEVARGIVALGHKDAVLRPVIDWLVQRNGRALDQGRSLLAQMFTQHTHERVVRQRAQIFTMNCSSILPRRSRPGCSSMWWLSLRSAMVETIAM